jgi:hypothetical protein
LLLLALRHRLTPGEASVNHERIAESFAQSLIRISEHILECKLEGELYDTPEMQKLTAKLYAHIFGYLSNVMDWLTKKSFRRLLDSFKEDFKQHFEADIEQIQLVAKQVQQLASFSGRAELRFLRTNYDADVQKAGAKLDSIEHNTRIGLEGQERQAAEMRHYLESMGKVLLAEYRDRQRAERHTEQLFQSIKSLLEDRALTWLQTPTTVAPISDNAGFPLQNFAPVTLISTVGTRTYSQDDIALWSSHLEDYFDRDRIRLESLSRYPTKGKREDDSTYPLQRVVSSQVIIDRLANWTRPGRQAGTANSSRTLWFRGPSISVDGFDNPQTTLSYGIVELASRVRVPLLSHFCELPRKHRLRAGVPNLETQALISLTYSLIRQVVEQLLPQFETAISLSPERFRQLDGTLASLGEAVVLLGEMLPLMGDVVLCIIDGLHWLDDRTTDSMLQRLINIFVEHDNIRVLFTTSGRSGCLLDALTQEDTLDVSGKEDGWGMEPFDANEDR